MFSRPRRVSIISWKSFGSETSMTSNVYIAKNVYGGDGLGRLGDGRVVFVAGAFAGESVKAEIVEEKRHFVKARLKEVCEPSPDRIGNGCAPVPGMVYANLDYAAEKREKASQLKEFFERSRIATAGRSDDFTELPGGAVKGEELNYRNKVVYHFARKGGDWVIGYRKESSHELVEVREDPLAVAAINAKLPDIRKEVLSLLTQGPKAIRDAVAEKGTVTIRWSERSGVKWWIGDAPKDVVIKECTCARTFEVPAGGFYQVNPKAGEALVKAVVAAYCENPGVADEVVDLYCGVGVFGLATGAKKLFGVESGRQAIEFAKRNAAIQRATGAEFLASEVGKAKKRLPIGEHTTVIVDPPREGLERGVAETLASSLAARIFYVSCDPATLVRDLKTLDRAYQVESVRWIDMFPRTARFETLVVLRRRGLA